MSAASSNGHRIVVGVDGSQASQEALAWAMLQAELTGASVDAVIAWHDPVVIGGYHAPCPVVIIRGQRAS
jgi:hypothetical protein